MKIFLFYFEMAIKIQGRHKIIGSVGLAKTHLFFLGLIRIFHDTVLSQNTSSLSYFNLSKQPLACSINTIVKCTCAF